MPLSKATWIDIIERSSDAIVVAKPNLDIVYANRAAYTLLGVSTGLEGRGLLAFVSPIHHQSLNGMTVGVSRTGEPTIPRWIPIQMRTESGRIQGVQVSLTPLKGDQYATLCFTCRLDTPDPRLQLLACAPDTLFLVSKEGRIEYANERAIETFGYALSALVGQPIEMLLPERYQKAHHQQRASYVKNPSPRPMGLGRQLTARTKDGSEFAAEVALSPVLVGDRNLTGVAVRDVTQKRLTDLRINTVHRVEALGRLAGGIAHDLNNILTAVLGFADSAREGLVGSTDFVNVDSDIGEIVIAGQRAKELIEKLLAFSRSRPAEPVVVDVNEALAALSPMLNRLLGSSIEYHTSLASDLWRTRIDPGAIEQVLVNLCVNAKDAMPKGGRLLVETSNVTIDATHGAALDVVTQPGDYVLLAVSDTGEGMDAETQKHIFEPFFSTKGPGEGTGLGLSTCYGLVTQAAGFIWVYSEVGRGTTFKVYLPRTSAEAAPREPTLWPQALTGSETILVAEDDPQVLAVTGRTLRKYGYHVLEARGWEEALEVCRGYVGSIDLLVTDVIMPGMNGRDLANEVVSRRPGVRVLFMSGYTDNVIVHHGIVDNNVNFISKPFAPESLAQRVRQLLRSG